MSLFDDVLGMAADSSRPLTPALRLALVLAQQLNHAELRDWVHRELEEGYYSNVEPPSYRTSREFPLHASYDDGIITPTLENLSAIFNFLDPIPVYESMLKVYPSGPLGFQSSVEWLPPRTRQRFNRGAKPVQLIPRREFTRIIEAARSQLYGFVLELAREFPQDKDATPKKLKVLFIAANPRDLNLRLWLDEEVHDIKSKIRQARYRDYVDFSSEWAIRTAEILQALNEHQPNIVHFSGHGSAANELILLDQVGDPKLVTKDAFKQMLKAVGGHIRLVILNSCHSRDLAEAAVEHVDAAVGMNTSIGDEAARVFAAQFHSAVGFGFSVQRAFDQAIAQLMMEGIPEEKTPELFIQPGLNADEIILVRPFRGR